MFATQYLLKQSERQQVFSKSQSALPGVDDSSGKRLSVPALPAHGAKSTQPATVWIVEVHRLCDGDDFHSENLVFATEQDCLQYMANCICDDIDYLYHTDQLSPTTRQKLTDHHMDASNDKVLSHIRQNNALVAEVLESIFKKEDKHCRGVMWLKERTRIYELVVGQGLLKYTLPVPTRTFDFDDCALGLQHIAHEMDLYASQLGHSEQEISTTDMQSAMKGHVATLQDMRTYQEYLQEVGECEEHASFDIRGALDLAHALLDDISKALGNN
jgi:hypothetical protein